MSTAAASKKGGKSTPTGAWVAKPQTPVAAGSSPVASPAPADVAGAFTPSLPPADQLLPGAHLRISTSAAPDVSFDAVLFVYDAAAGLLIVERAYDFSDDRNENNRSDNSGRKDYAMLTVQHTRSVTADIE